MSLHVLANHMATKGRGPDSMLVHMAPHEVDALQALAMKNGGTLTINPETGLPEAGFLSKLLPMIAGFALAPLTAGTSLAFLAATPMATALTIGGATGLATGSLKKGLMAGLGAYGGAGLGESLMNAGAGSLGAQGTAGALGVEGAATGLGSQAAMLAEQNAGFGAEGLSRLADSARVATGANPIMPSASSLMSKGFDAAALNPMQFAKSNMGNIAAAAAPIAADMMTPTTTKMPDMPKSYIRQKTYDPFTQTYRDVGPVDASQWGDRRFSDINRGYSNGGGIVALRRGGTGFDTSVGHDVEFDDMIGNRNAPSRTLVRDPASMDNAPVQVQQPQGPVQQAPVQQAPAGLDFSQMTNPEKLLVPQQQNPSGIQALMPQQEQIEQPMMQEPSAPPMEQPVEPQPRNITEPQPRPIIEPAEPQRPTRQPEDIGGGMVPKTTPVSPVPVDSTKKPLLSAQEIGKMLVGLLPNTFNFDMNDLVAASKRESLEEEKPITIMPVEQPVTTTPVTTTPVTVPKLGPTGTLGPVVTTPTDTSKVTDIPKPVITTVGGTSGFTTNPLEKAKQDMAAQAAAKTARDTGLLETYRMWTMANPNATPQDEANFLDKIGLSPATAAQATKLSAQQMQDKYYDAKYNKTTGDSKAAYDFLMGKGAYPTKSSVGEIMKPYREATLGMPASTNKAYTFDQASGKYTKNPDYVPANRDSTGKVSYGMSQNQVSAALKASPMSGQALYDWAMSNNIDAQTIAAATGMSLSDVYSQFRDAQVASAAAAKAKTTAAAIEAGSSATRESGGDGDGGGGDGGGGGGVGGGGGGGEARGGLMPYHRYHMASGGMFPGYALGGLGSLGGYSDGGRLLKGPGDGVSDSIPATIGQKQQPARLADGEFVVPARIVSELGNGSTDAGARKLYAMMDRVQAARGRTTGKSRVAANTRADKHLPA